VAKSQINRLRATLKEVRKLEYQNEEIGPKNYKGKPKYFD